MLYFSGIELVGNFYSRYCFSRNSTLNIRIVSTYYDKIPTIKHLDELVASVVRNFVLRRRYVYDYVSCSSREIYSVSSESESQYLFCNALQEKLTSVCKEIRGFLIIIWANFN